MFAVKTINQVRKISTSTLKSNPKFYGFLEHQPFEFSPVSNLENQKVVRNKFPQRTLIDSSYRNPRHTNDRQQWSSKQTKLRSSIDMDKGSRRKLHVFVPQYQAEKPDQAIKEEEFISSRDSFKMSDKGSKSSSNSEMKNQGDKWSQEHGLQKDIDTSAFYTPKRFQNEEQRKQQDRPQQQQQQQQQDMKQSSNKQQSSKSERDQEFSQYESKDSMVNEQRQNQGQQRETYSMAGQYQNKSSMLDQPQQSQTQQRAAFSESSKNRMFGNEEMGMKSDSKKQQQQNSQSEQPQSSLSGQQKEVVEGRAGSYPNGQSFDESEPQSWRGEEFKSNTASSTSKTVEMGKSGDGREEFKLKNDPVQEKKQYK